MSRPDRTDGLPRRFDLFGFVVLVVMFAVPAGTITAPLAEYDTGWHLRTGRWIVEHRGVPHADTFSTVGEDKLWVAYSWLYDLGLYGAFEAFGLVGVLMCRVTLVLGIVAALYFLVRRRQPALTLAAAVVTAAAVALWPLFVADRPGLVSILFIIWTVEAVLALREGRGGWKIWLLPGVYVLWANIHVQFVHGLFIMGLAWIAPWLSVALGRAPTSARPQTADMPLSPGWWRLTALVAACVLATLCNPYHVYLYEVVLTYARQKETYNLFEELKSIAFRQPADWFVLGLTCAACFALGRRQKLDVFEILLLAAGAYFSFHARHDTWFVVLAACVILSGRSRAQDALHQTPGFGVAHPGAAHAMPQGEVLRTLGVNDAIVLLPIAVAVLAARFFLHGISEERLQADLAREFPVAAAGFIEDNKLPGPIYNPIDWGGYLIWRLPQYQVGIDGRAQLHGERRTKRFIDVWHGRAGWSEDADLLGSGVVLLQQDAPLAELLRRDSRWRQVYASDLAVAFVKE